MIVRMRPSYPARTAAKSIYIYNRGAAATAAAFLLIVEIVIKRQISKGMIREYTYMPTPNYLFAKDLNRRVSADVWSRLFSTIYQHLFNGYSNNFE